MRHARPLPARVLGDAVRSASDHAGPWPRISIWQGDEDATVVAGVADDLVRQWRDVHGAGVGAAELSASGRRRHTVWRNRRGEAVVELHQLSGMGHGAPLGCALDEGCGTAGPYLLEVGVASSLEIARSWGLAAQRPSGAAIPASPLPVGHGAGPAWSRVAARGTPQPSSSHVVTEGIGDVITGALRSAGLLR